MLIKFTLKGKVLHLLLLCQDGLVFETTNIWMFTKNENLEVVFGEVKVVEVAVKGKLPFLLFTQTEECC